MQKVTTSVAVAAVLGAGSFLVGSFADSLPLWLQGSLAWVGILLILGACIAWGILWLTQPKALPGAPNSTQGRVPLYRAAADLYGKLRLHNKNSYAVLAAESAARTMFRKDADGVLVFYVRWLREEGPIYGKIYPSEHSEELDFSDIEGLGYFLLKDGTAEFVFHEQGRHSITELTVDAGAVSRAFHKYKDWLQGSRE